MRKSFYITAGIVKTASIPFLRAIRDGMNLPDGPCIVAANHSSFLDGPLLAYAYASVKLRPVHMIAYEEPFDHWLMGWILRSGKCIPFRRGDNLSQFDMLKAALGWLAAGDAVGIFPEGHINQGARLNSPRPGAAMLALESGAPIIPTAIVGSDLTLPVRAKIPRPGRRIVIRFGQPIGLFPKELRYRDSDADDRKNMIDSLGVRIMNEIANLTGRKSRTGTARKAVGQADA